MKRRILNADVDTYVRTHAHLYVRAYARTSTVRA